MTHQRIYVVGLLIIVSSFYAGNYRPARRLSRYGVTATVTVVDTFEYAGGEIVFE